MKEKIIAIKVDDNESISGILCIPEVPGKSSTGIVFAHGAANDMNHESVAGVAQGIARNGHITLRFNFPYREKGKNSPDPEHRLALAWQKAMAALESTSPYPLKRIIAAGKSLGARIASQAAAEGVIKPDGLIFLGYPLHAPGKKEKLRDRHLYDLSIPMLFFEGTRDPFCDLELLNTVLDNLNCPKTIKLIQGGDHSFVLPKADERSPQDVLEQIVADCLTWLEQRP